MDPGTLKMNTLYTGESILFMITEYLLNANSSKLRHATFSVI